jgi:hypothetical protein
MSFDPESKSYCRLKMSFFKVVLMFHHIRKFEKRFFASSFVRKKQTDRLRIPLNIRDLLLDPLKSYQQNILFCKPLRFSLNMLNIYNVPMQKFSTTPKKTDLNSEKKRLEDRQQLQPKAATLQKILQFASSYRVERINENQYVDWYLN